MWIKLDDGWMEHPKMLRAGRDARDVWLAGLSYCARRLTDGVIPEELLPMLAVTAGVDVANIKQIASKLLEVRLWEGTEGGYIIHDYLDYNPSKADAEATREARKEAGRAGGRAKASKMPSKTLAKSKQNSAPYPYLYPSPYQEPNPGNERGEVVVGAPAPAASPAFTPQTIEEKIYCAVTLHPTIPSGEIDSVLDRIAKIRAAKGIDPNQAIECLRPFWQAQKARYPGSTKTFWLDWALIGEIPRPGTNGKKSGNHLEENLRVIDEVLNGK